MVHKFLDGNSEDEIQLFKRALLCFREKEKYESCGDEIKAGEEAERAYVIKTVADSIECKSAALPFLKYGEIEGRK